MTYKRNLPVLKQPLRVLLSGTKLGQGPTGQPPASALARWDKQVSLSARAYAAAAKEHIVEVLDVIGNFGDFGGVSAEKVSKSLKDAGAAKPVRVLVNSPGGDMFEGIAIYNLLRAHAGKVTVRVIGEAASAASVIAMAGDRIEMDESAFMMIHNAWGMAVGDANEMKDFAELLARYDANIAEVYAARSGRDVSEVAKMMKSETWMSAPEALAKNFADEVLPNEEGAAAAKGKTTTISLKGPSFDLRAALGALGDRGAVALGATKPGAPGPAAQPKGTKMKTVKEQISAFEAKRQASAARMSEIMNKASEEGRGLEDTEAQEYDGLRAEVKGCDDHIVRLKDHEKVMAASAVPALGDDPVQAAASRAGERPRGSSPILSVRSNAPKGSGFTRYVIALSHAKGNKFEAAQIAKVRWPDMPEVGKALLAAVDPGTTTDPTWAAPLVVVDNLAAEFIDLLMPETIIGRITGFRRVPFNVKMPRKTAGSTVKWVGQGKSKPVSELAFDSVTLGFAKIAGIVVLTEELVRFSSPAAEGLVRSDLIETIAKFMDEQFIDPDVAAVANVSPASVLNAGITPVSSSGATVADVDFDAKEVMAKFIAANIPLNRGVWVMNPRSALSLSMLRTTQDIKAYPDISPQGGIFWGLPVVTSNNVPVASTSGDPTIIALIAPQEILLADDGGVSIDVSREASLQMDSAPSSGAQEMVSLWQENLVGLKAERFCNWLKRRAAAAQYIDDVQY